MQFGSIPALSYSVHDLSSYLNLEHGTKYALGAHNSLIKT
jgi:hypothetical protein